MKLAMMSDIHLRASSPTGRTDDFVKRMWSKFSYMVEYCNENGIKVLILAGDIFESVHVGHPVIKAAYKILNEFNGVVYIVYGNHDLKNHNFEKRHTSPLDLLLEVCDNVVLLDGDANNTYKNIHMYGTSWNQAIPEIENEEKFNILVIHKMIIKEKLWPGQEVDADGKGLPLLKNNDFDLIVSGDNHQQFVLHHKGKYLVNSGSMMRSCVNQVDATPAFYVMNTRSGNPPTKVPFPIEEEVFDMEKLQQQAEQSESIEKFSSFIEFLSESRNSNKLSFSAIYNSLLIKTQDEELIKYSSTLFEEV